MDEIALARNYLDTLLATERASSHELEAYQQKLLASLYRHARRNVPFYSNYPEGSGEAVLRHWEQLPTISRMDLVQHAPALKAMSMPPNHGTLIPVQTGGSTGEPVQVILSGMEQIARVVSTYRMFLAWDMDMALPMFMIRKPQIGWDRSDGVGFRRWGFPWLPESTLGERRHLDIATPVDQQIDCLVQAAPACVNTLPSNILRLGLRARQNTVQPQIPIIISVAEYLAQEVRSLAEVTFSSRVIDILSSAEGGVIAIACPVSGLMHIQSEAVLAEIIGSDGQPCRAGEIGELVVTPLYNYATPLLRYRSGDFVEKGPPCPCGRSLPTISRVVGRREHLFVFPGGQRALPPINRVQISDLLRHEEWRLVQTGSDRCEFQTAGKNDQQHADELIALLKDALHDKFSISIRSVDRLPLTSGGKRHFCVNALH